jgi:hypothetical protein
MHNICRHITYHVCLCAGSWQNQPAKVMKCGQEGDSICTSVNPRNWAGQQLCEDVIMSSKVTLEGDKAHIAFSLKYTGAAENPVRIQELPAVFFNRNLSQLWFYDGGEPWKVGREAGGGMQASYVGSATHRSQALHILAHSLRGEC